MSTAKMRRIVAAVAAYYEVDHRTLTAPRASTWRFRSRRAAPMRWAAMRIIRERLGCSYVELGRFFHCDHTTAIDACKREIADYDAVVRAVDAYEGAAKVKGDKIETLLRIVAEHALRIEALEKKNGG